MMYFLHKNGRVYKRLHTAVMKESGASVVVYQKVKPFHKRDLMLMLRPVVLLVAHVGGLKMNVVYTGAMTEGSEAILRVFQASAKEVAKAAEIMEKMQTSLSLTPVAYDYSRPFSAHRLIPAPAEGTARAKAREQQEAQRRAALYANTPKAPLSRQQRKALKKA